MDGPDVETTWKMLFKTVEAVRNYQAGMVQNGPRPDITISQMRVIGCVIMSPGGRVKLREIADELSITPGGISQIVDHLVRCGLLERVTDPDDRRAVVITLSRFGRELHGKLDDSFNRLFRRLLASISDENIAVFNQVLDHINHNLEKERSRK